MNIKYLPVKRRDNCSIEYPYLTGKTIEELLLKDIHNSGKLLEAFEKTFHYIFCVKDDQVIPFEITDPYKKIFGEWSLKEGVPALAISNLDINFGNLMLHDGKIYCFDYEWIFDFPIPVNFMKLRCFNVFHSKYNMYYAAKLRKEEILQRIGIGKEDFAVLTKMDLKFQEFVYGPDNKSQYLCHYKKPCGVMECRGL